MKQICNTREWTRIWNFSIRDYDETPGEGGAQSSEIEVEVGAKETPRKEPHRIKSRGQEVRTRMTW